MTKIILRQRVADSDPAKICDALSAWSGLSKIRVKTAMRCGAVWRQQPRGGTVRVRRATATARTGDLICLYYDEAIQGRTPPKARCQHDTGHYSIWFKPAGLMTQGSKFGDHCSLVRQVEQHYAPKRKVLLVHRLDREAQGLVLFAHDKKTAANFALMFRNRTIEKNYQILVSGNLEAYHSQNRIDFPLDGRPAATEFTPLRYDKHHDQTVVRVRLLSGRFHQIRRHFNQLGHPVMGDPRYGTKNKNHSGLRLVAYRLAFTCPISGRFTEVAVDPDGVF